MLPKIITFTGLVLSLSACFGTDKSTDIKLGEAVFEKHCTRCHGKAGVGLSKNWRQALPDGSYPPPPLNGTAHTWHHSPRVLLKTIEQGGVKLGGKMPGFKNKLSGREKQAILDYLYALWPPEIQQKYDARFK